MSSFERYYFGVILRPSPTFAALVRDDHRLRYGFMAIGLNIVLYTLVYIFLTAGAGAPSSFTPWLAIPKESYYFYNRFLLAPSMLLAWIASAGVAQLLSKPFGGKAEFEDMLSLFGFAVSVACLASLLHDLPDSFLGAVGLIDLKEYEVALNSPTIWRVILLTLYSLSVLWFFLLYIKAVKVAQQISRGPAMLVGSVSYILYQVVFLIFNR